MKLFKFTLPFVIAIVITIIYLLQSCGGVHYNSYVENYKDIAIEEMIRTGYPASIKLAQAILESEGGRSELAIDHNNHFGILCDKKWKGPKHRITEEDFTTGERFESCYKVYDNPAVSFVEHTNLLKRDPHYQSLFHLNSSNYVLWAERLMELGYTNNDTYDLTLINMIEKYNLDTYDDIALGNEPTLADASDQEVDENIPSDFDYQDESLVDRIREKEERARVNIEDRLDNLRENITDHKSEYSEEHASWRRELEEQLDNNYAGQDYDREQRIYQTRAERYSPTTYNDPSNRQPSSQNAIDAKYKDLYKTDYSTPNRRTYKEPIKQPYSAPNKRQNRSNYSTASAIPQEEDHWLSQATEGTSISDFDDNHTYINRSLVTYAKYHDSPLTIAKRYNISVKDIIEFNESIRNNTQILKEGKIVYLEAKKKNYLNGQKYHIVQTAEKMEDIAAMYGLLLNELYAKNRMPVGSQPALGERIKLDKGKIRQRPELRSNYKNEYQSSKPIAPPRSVAIDAYNHDQPVRTELLQPVTTNKISHIVQDGETLFGIARMYNISPEKLMRQNGLRTSSIRRGDQLRIN